VPVKRIFVVMMENRSFDHMLGHLSLDGHDVDGIQGGAWLQQVANPYNGHPYEPFALTDPYSKTEADPPHSRSSTALQLGKWDGRRYPMKGFVDTYAKATGASPISPGGAPLAMGYFTGRDAPVSDFLARNFAVCDRWHAPLPAGTQPNRLMAMSGFTPFDYNETPMPHQKLVYDWLEEAGIRWRVYHAGIPFMALMPSRLGQILAGRNFRKFGNIWADVMNEPPGTFPQVVFLEPLYADAPHIGPSSDDHAPGGIKEGQGFLHQCYRALTRVPAIWKDSVMIVTYDEHGGFFDHVSPPRIRTDPPPGGQYKDGPFESLGVRVPALVISPMVTPGHVFHGVMDHISILKLIGDVFGGRRGYSELVNARPVESVSAVLNHPAGDRERVPAPTLKEYLEREPRGRAGRVPGTRPETDIQHSFQRALDDIRTHPDRRKGEFAEELRAFPRGQGAGS
jgi:phospholipase C